MLKKIIFSMPCFFLFIILPGIINAEIDATVYNYEYAESGYSGGMEIKNIKNERYSVRINTVNNSNMSLCEVEETCIKRGNKIICKINDPDYPNQTVTITGLGNDIVNVDAKMQAGYACGNGAYFDGKYKRVKEAASANSGLGQVCGFV